MWGSFSTAPGSWEVPCELLLRRTLWKSTIPEPDPAAAAEPLPGS